jgi:hypothetical protein
MKNTIHAFKVGNEWRLAIGSRSGRYVVCLDKKDAEDRAMKVLGSCGGSVKFFEEESPVKPFEIWVTGGDPRTLENDHPL